jgi:hypothetical protein
MSLIARMLQLSEESMEGNADRKNVRATVAEIAADLYC